MIPSDEPNDTAAIREDQTPSIYLQLSPSVETLVKGDTGDTAIMGVLLWKLLRKRLLRLHIYLLEI